MASRVKKKLELNGVQEQLAPAVVTQFQDLWPEIAWQLQSPYWGGDKGSREQGALSLFWQDGLAKVALRERNYGQVAFLAGSTVHEVLTKLETALAAVTVHWRQDKYARKE